MPVEEPKQITPKTSADYLDVHPVKQSHVSFVIDDEHTMHGVRVLLTGDVRIPYIAYRKKMRATLIPEMRGNRRTRDRRSAH